MSTLPIILIVDDEPTNIEALASALQEHYEVQFALSGEEAIARMQEKPLPELILLDVILPDVNGYEVCQQLRRNPQSRNVPIIFVTALSSSAQEARGLELGAVDFISKPISPAIVRARVRNHLDIKRTREQLERLTLTDSLTGLANRRHFDSALAHEAERNKRSQSPLSLILLDIDFFKNYNDQFGHAAGDSCLQMIGRVLQEQLARPIDLAARVGGEEFACLLPDTTKEGALQVASRVHAAINQQAIAHSHSSVAPHVTASFGVATAEREASVTALYQAADAALYRAKAAGRNQTSE